MSSLHWYTKQNMTDIQVSNRICVVCWQSVLRYTRVFSCSCESHCKLDCKTLEFKCVLHFRGSLWFAMFQNSQCFCIPRGLQDKTNFENPAYRFLHFCWPYMQCFSSALDEFVWSPSRVHNEESRNIKLLFAGQHTQNTT